MQDNHENILELFLKNQFQISESKYSTINNKYYIDGESDMFIGLNHKQIQFMILCISIADTQILTQQNINDNFIVPEYLSIEFTQKVISYFLSTNRSRNIELIEKAFNHADKEDILFHCSYNKETKTFKMLIKTDIFINSHEKDYTRVYVGDVLKSNGLMSLYIKLKISKFLSMECNHGKIQIIISREKFKEWSGCGQEIAKYIKNSLHSINKENNISVKFDYDITDENRIFLYVDNDSYVNHVIDNCQLTMEESSKYNNKKKTKSIC